jgi:hypothetical protein
MPTNRTWIGGSAGNDAAAAANWTGGAPQPGDNLTVVSGTLELHRGDLRDDVLHLVDPNPGGGPVTLNLHGGGTRVGIDGSLFFGDDLTVNATGKDFLDASGGFNAINGTINLANCAHLFVTGAMDFAYSGAITGGTGSHLTNYGRIEMTNGQVSTLVNGSGTLSFVGYHNAYGHSLISAPVTMAQTVELNPGSAGMTLELSDPYNFHALLSVDRVAGHGDVSVQVDGVHADGFSVNGDRVRLTNAGQVVDVLRVANAGALPITATDGAAGTTLTFHEPIA